MGLVRRKLNTTKIQRENPTLTALGVAISNSWSARGKRANVPNGRIRGKSEEGLAAWSLCQMRVRTASKCSFSHRKRKIRNLEGTLTAGRRIKVIRSNSGSCNYIALHFEGRSFAVGRSCVTHAVIESEPHQESHSLWNAKNWMKAVSRGDSVLFLCRQQVSVAR